MSLMNSLPVHFRKVTGRPAPGMVTQKVINVTLRVPIE